MKEQRKARSVRRRGGLRFHLNLSLRFTSEIKRGQGPTTPNSSPPLPAMFLPLYPAVVCFLPFPYMYANNAAIFESTRQNGPYNPPSPLRNTDTHSHRSQHPSLIKTFPVERGQTQKRGPVNQCLTPLRQTAAPQTGSIRLPAPPAGTRQRERPRTPVPPPSFLPSFFRAPCPPLPYLLGSFGPSHPFVRSL